MTPLLAALEQFAPADWTRGAVLAEVDRLGWASGLDEEYGNEVRWVEAAGVRGRLVETDWDRAREQGVEVEAISFSPDGGTLDDAVDLLGPPASIVDGPALRWYRPLVRLEVEPGRVTLAPMPWSEDDENYTFEWADGLDGMPYRWRADRDDLLPDGLYLSGGRITESVDEALEQLAPLFTDLQRAAVLVPSLVGRPTWILHWVVAPTAFVQGYFAVDETVLEFWNEGERAHLLELPATPESADSVLQVVRSAIEASEVTAADELRWTLFANGTDYRLRTLGLGLPEGD